MKKIVAFLVAVLLCVSCFSVFAEEAKVKLVAVYSATVDDKGWNQAMDSGIKNAIAQGYNIDYTVLENVAVPDAPSVLDRLVDEYDVIIVHGAQYLNAVQAAAEENPEQVFVVGTTDLVLSDNVFTYMPASEEPGYINGYIAGLLSKTGKVGVVGSSDSGDAARYVRGYVLGFRAARPDAGDPIVSWTGSFNDTIGAGDNAGIMISAGCDVLTGSSQQAVGALRRVADAGMMWTAQTLAQMTDFPETTVCAADYEYAAVVINVLNDMNNGVKGGKCIPMTYSNGGFVFQYSDLISDDVKAKVDAVMQQVVENPGSIDYKSVVLK